MKNQKLKLNELQVKSFTTSISMADIKGGYRGTNQGDINAPTDTCTGRRLCRK